MLLILWRTIEDHDTLFVLAEAAHFVGIGLLGWKIWTKKSVAGAQQQRTLEEARRVGRRSTARAAVYARTPRCIAAAQLGSSAHHSCAPAAGAAGQWLMRAHNAQHQPPPPKPGLSLQTQVLTATFLVVRLYCSFMMEYDVHTLLDLLTAAATGGVLYAMLATPVSGGGGAAGRLVGWLAAWLLRAGGAVAAVAHARRSGAKSRGAAHGASRAQRPARGDFERRSSRGWRGHT